MPITKVRISRDAYRYLKGRCDRAVKSHYDNFIRESLINQKPNRYSVSYSSQCVAHADWMIQEKRYRYYALVDYHLSEADRAKDKRDREGIEDASD